MKKLLPFFILSLLLSSCDPGFVVTINNKSSNNKNIRVIVSNKAKLTFLDSIAIIDSSNASQRFKTAVSIDVNTSSYSFTLDKEKTAVIQQGTGSADLNEKIIVDFSDTILLKKDKRVSKKKTGISTSITVRLD